MRPAYFFAAAACLCAACRSKPKAEQIPAEVARAAAPAPIAPAASSAIDAGVPAAFSALAGMWHGRMTYNTSPSPPGPDDDNGIRGRAVSAKIYDGGSVSLAIQQFKTGPGFGQTGASSRCTIDGAIERRGEQLVFVERASACTGQFALARRTGLDILSTCQLRFTDLDKPAGAGALFTLRRQGCRAEHDR
jgi:hypothetical protein